MSRERKDRRRRGQRHTAGEQPGDEGGGEGGAQAARGTHPEKATGVGTECPAACTGPAAPTRLGTQAFWVGLWFRPHGFFHVCWLPLETKTEG